MSQPGRKPGVNATAKVREHLKKNSLKWITVKDLLVAGFGADLSEEQLRSKLSYLVKEGQAKRSGRGEAAKWKYVAAKDKVAKDKPSGKGGLKIGTAIHEQVDQYISSTSNQPPEFLPQVALDVRASQVVDEVDEHEPEGTFKVTGSLLKDMRFVGTVVSITSPGWSDRPYLVTEL